jgi:tRNA A-37 threonylcarbamoyl transferase component Bud32
MGWVEILPRYAALFRRWDSAASFLSWTGILVNKHRNRQVEQVELDGESFFIKKEYAVSWRDRLRSAWDGFGWCANAVREAAMLQALRQAGIGCPDVVALGEDGRQAFVVTRAEPAMTELRAILPTLSREQRICLADALGRELARMHDAGFDHPDLMAKHILAETGGDTYRFCVLDWQRGGRRRTVPWRRRIRDLAILDATLADALAGDRLRMRCLRSYCRALATDAPPLRRLAESIRRRSVECRKNRNIREAAQAAPPPADQQFVTLCEGRLLVVRSYFEELGEQAPEWMTSLIDVESWDGSGLAFASGMTTRRVQAWPVEGDTWELPPLAHTLFRLQRFGVRAPRLLAVGRSRSQVFALMESMATTPFPKALADASADVRSRMLSRAGALVRQIHEAGYHLPPGGTWDQRLGVLRASGEVVLARVEPLLRGADEWQELAARELRHQKLILSRTEQLRFLQGYLGRRRVRRTMKSRAPELQGVA